MDSHWELVKENFKSRLAPSAYQLWIEPLQANLGVSGELILECPNPFFLHWVHNNYLTDIAREYQAISGTLTLIKLGLSQIERRREVQPPILQPCLPNLKKPRGFARLLNKSFTFDRFVVGASNRLAFQASRALANDDTLYSKTLFLSSQPGLGKSHLSQAVGNYIQTNFRSDRVFYLTAEDFANEMVTALRQGNMSQFKEKFRQQCDTLLMEGVHFLSGKDKIQTELCYTLDFLADQNKKLVFTSPYLPAEIPHLRPELISRLSGGVITPIDPPDFSTRVNILSHKASDFQARVPQEVLEHLATYLTQDVRQMVSALDNVLLKAATLKMPVDLGLADEVLHDFQVVTQKLKIVDIQQILGKVYQVRQEDMLGRSRKKKVVLARNLAIYLSRHYLQKSLKELAHSFRRTHSTILHSLECVERDRKTSPKFATELEYLEKKLQTSSRWRRCVQPRSNPSSAD
jgi:chromosomal replication initiator protein